MQLLWRRSLSLWSNPTSANHAAGAIQSLVIAIAVVVGGAWTALEFGLLNKRGLAELQLRELQTGLAEVSLSATPYLRPSSLICTLNIVATVRNAGRRKLLLEFERESLLVSYADVSGTGVSFADATALSALSFADTTLEVLPLPESLLIPGEVLEYPYLLPVANNSDVFVEFRVPVVELDMTGERIPSADTLLWTARGFFRTCEVPTVTK